MATLPKTFLTLPADPGAVKITEEQFRQYLNAGLSDDRGELVTHGPWSIPVRFIAPAVSYVWGRHGFGVETITLYGRRSLSRPVESGYQLEGRVSVGGMSCRGFTGSQLWELPDGRLIETAVVHVVLPKGEDGATLHPQAR